MEENYTYISEGSSPSKSWSFTEENKKHVTYHTFTIAGKRFSHQAEVREAAHSYRQRTDFNLDNVNSVNSYYGLSRNVVGTAILAILAVAGFAGGIYGLFSDMGPASFAILAVGALFALFSYLTYKNASPSFMLEIETVVPQGQLKKQSFAYGNADASFGKKGPGLIGGLFLLIFFPIGILYLISRSNKGNKYKFKMDEQTGLEIVDTIGARLIEE